MAFTNTPSNDTYRTIPIPIDGTTSYRSGNLATRRDLRIFNLYYDRISQENKEREVRLVKRDGLATTFYSLGKVSAASALRGSYNDVDTNTFYWAVEDKVYSVSPDTSSLIRTVAILASSSGYVGFTSFLKASGDRYVLFSDGNTLWVDDYTTATQVTDVNLPSPHKPYPIYLNGYVFLIKSDTGEIYNSENDDPTVWPPDEFIVAEINSDWGERIFKVKNYIICLGKSSIEFFWDAGNDTGSPLSRNDSPTRNLGYVTAGAQSGDAIFFVGQDEKQNLGVYTLDGFKVNKVSNSIVDRTLQTSSSIDNTKSNVFLNRDGYIVSTNGHTFYVLVTSQTTWVLDIDEKLWYEWTGADGQALNIEAAWGMFNGACYVAIGGRTEMSKFSPTVYQDFGQNFICRYVTENIDAGSMNWKVATRLVVDGAQQNFTGSSNLSVYWSDNDWADSGTAFRVINVFGISPMMYNLGRFRRRSFRLEYADNYPWFISNLYLTVNIMGH